MTPPLVSVLMTSFNREALIASAIESVLRQTLTDFELITLAQPSWKVGEHVGPFGARLAEFKYDLNAGEWLIRFEPSELLSKQAALRLMNRPDLPDDKAKGAAAIVIRTAIRQSRRSAAGTQPQEWSANTTLPANASGDGEEISLTGVPTAQSTEKTAIVELCAVRDQVE